MILFLFPLMCAISAYVISQILITQGMLLWPVFNFFVKEHDMPEWLHKPLMTCSYCVAGQWSLWGYIYLRWSDYNLLHHIWVILFAIFSVEVIRWILGLSFSIEIHNKINNGN
jgi:hypothetical protein